LQGVPENFPAQMLHSQTVLEPPAGASTLARNAHDAHQMLRFSEKAVSVQFHPEFRVEAMRAYCDVLDGTKQAGSPDFMGLKQSMRDTPEATGILTRFVRECMAA